MSWVSPSSLELLDDPNTKIEAVVRDFGDRNPQEDPVIHFYEHFLAAYDKKQKVSRGVFYTPRPGGLLHRAFGGRTAAHGVRARRRPCGHYDLGRDGEAPRGSQGFRKALAPTGRPSFRFSIPATGTGTFLVEVVDLIHRTMVEKWKAQGHQREGDSGHFGMSTSRSTSCRACTVTNS